MLLTLLENYSGHQVEYILTCESDTERQRWLEAVSPSQHGLPEETLYEVWDCPQVVALYCYSPNQPDELSLHPGIYIYIYIYFFFFCEKATFTDFAFQLTREAGF